MNLLSANDFIQLENAMLQHEEIVLTRKLGTLEMTACTFRVAAPWDVEMIIQIAKDYGHIKWIQNFTNINDAIQASKR